MSRSLRPRRDSPLLLALILAACGPSADAENGPERSLDDIREDGTLIVATRNAPTTWYIDRHGEPTGPEYELIDSFASWLGVEADFRIHDTISAAMDAVADGEADVAAAGLTITAKRRERFRFGPGYQPIRQQLVCRRGGPQPQSPAEMPGHDIHVIADSAYVERLEELAQKHPELDWQEREGVTTELLLQEVWQQEIDCTIADSTIVDMNRRLFRELVVSQDLTGEQQLGWALPKERDDLETAIEEWLRDFKQTSRMDRHREAFYGHLRRFDYVDSWRFVRAIDERFWDLQPWFRTAGTRNDIPYTLLAAVAYQESHWREDAVSPTGVRGVMMLTQRAAEQINVDNRLDPRESIFGGARYLDWMRSRIAEEVEEPDRTFLALAAYNVGRGHLHDAQGLARELGKDPHSWADMREVLPLLADPQYYHDLRFGYARGMEPVVYVTRVREYRHMLENYLYGHPGGPQ